MSCKHTYRWCCVMTMFQWGLWSSGLTKSKCLWFPLVYSLVFLGWYTGTWFVSLLDPPLQQHLSCSFFSILSFKMLISSMQTCHCKVFGCISWCISKIVISLFCTVGCWSASTGTKMCLVGLFWSCFAVFVRLSQYQMWSERLFLRFIRTEQPQLSPAGFGCSHQLNV